MIVQPKTWKIFIENHPERKNLDANMARVSKAFSPARTPAELLELALGADPSIFLVLPFETVAPSVIHHVTKVFKSPLSNEANEHFCLMGWDESAAAIKINPENFFGKLVSNQIEGENSNKVNKLRIEGLRNALNKDHFNNDPRTIVIEDETIELRKCIPLTPSIASLFFDIEAEDPYEIGALLVEKIDSIERDVNHSLHEILVSIEGKKMMDEILTWLWYAPKIADMKVHCPIAHPRSRIDKAARNLHSNALSKTLDTRQESKENTGEFAAVIASALEKQASDSTQQSRQMVAALQELAEAKRDGSHNTSASSEKGFSKLPSCIQKFLLAMASQDLEEPAMELPKSGLDMLNMSQKHAAITLPNLMRANGRSCARLSSSFIQDVTSLLWFDHSDPFTGLSTCRMAPLIQSLASKSTAAKKAKKLELLERLEVDRHEVIEELMDDSLFRPSSATDLIHNMETIQGILEIYIGPQSAIVQRIFEFTSEMKKKTDSLDQMALADTNFLTKIQYSFDKRLNEWMDTIYQHSENLPEVDHSLIDFMTIDRNIKHDCFFVPLPPELRPKNKRPLAEILDGNSNGNPDDDHKNKQRKSVTNNDQNPSWKLKENESWEIFNKDPNKLRPSSVCLMYHILGFCPQGDSCRRAKSHKKLTNAEQIKRTDAFIEDCRKNARP